MSTDKQDAINIISETVPKEAVKRKRKRLRRFVINFTILFIVSSLFVVNWQPLKISKETTYVTEPRTADGKRIDYFRAFEEKLYPPEMKTDENGFRLILKNLGDQFKYEKNVYNKKTNQQETIKLDPVPLRRQVYEKVGLDPDTPPILDVKPEEWSAESYITELDKNGKLTDELLENFKPENSSQEKLSILRDVLYQTPWTLQQLPFMEDWVKASEKPLEIIAEATRKPEFCFPLFRDSDEEELIDLIGSLCEVQITRDWTRTLQIRANYRKGIGDIDGAIDDKITCMRLGRHVRKPVSFNWLVGAAIEGIGWAIDIYGNPEHKPTAQQLARLQSEIDAISKSATIEECLEFERLYTLSCMQMVYHSNKTVNESAVTNIPFLPPLAASWCINSNVVMKNTNNWFDTIIKDVKHGFTADKAVPSTNPLKYIFVNSRSKQVSDVLLMMMNSTVKALSDAQNRIQCVENMSRLNLALLRYEAEHGKFPDGNWRTAILPYLGEEGEKYFRCPTTELAEDETTYAMIKRENGEVPDTPNTLLLVEVWPPQKMSEGNGTTEPKLGGFDRVAKKMRDGIGSQHNGGCNATQRGGSVSFLSETISAEKFNELVDGTAKKKW
ncbi:MAG: hypothetical protein ACRC2T_10755 [Thermoguttaceae bacterium]